MDLKPIGIVESCFPEKFGTPRQSGLVSEARAFIKINKELQPEESLEGLEGFSHLWVLFWFHKNSSDRFHAKVHPPRMLGEKIGVFATRSPHRPNPIGLSLVKIESIEKEGVWITGVDFITGTPVIDIKPYLPFVESLPDARSGWAKEESTRLQVEWSNGALEFLATQENSKRLKVLIEESLSLDPRPVLYRGYEGVDSPYRNHHAMRVFDLDVHFEFVSSGVLRVNSLRLWDNCLKFEEEKCQP